MIVLIGAVVVLVVILLAVAILNLYMGMFDQVAAIATTYNARAIACMLISLQLTTALAVILEYRGL